MSRQLFKTEKMHSLLYPIFFFYLLNLIVFTLSRLGLSLWQIKRVNAVHSWGELFFTRLTYGHCVLVLPVRCAGTIQRIVLS
ncbi:hypothetical protein HMPREF9996_02186 [Aggregatibacter actinomycetemcomitans Y4]|nr:hypothetical protein HMPREF9996_02186 [Aggregatibacter actinomycetemcomitans Y4]